MRSILPQRPDTPGVVAPPPLVFAGFLLLGIGIDRMLGGIVDMGPWRYWIGGGLAAAALVFLVPALGLFRRFGTRAEPWQPTTAIVTSGIYTHSRNPMYVGMAFAHAGIALIAGSLAALALLAAALAVIRHGVITREEAYLADKFGAEYLAYKARVRRWL